MKNNMVKKLLTLALAGAMTLSLAACGSKSDDSSNDAQQGGDESGKTYKVAIISSSTTPLSTRLQTLWPPSSTRSQPTIM